VVVVLSRIWTLLKGFGTQIGSETEVTFAREKRMREASKKENKSARARAESFRARAVGVSHGENRHGGVGIRRNWTLLPGYGTQIGSETEVTFARKKRVHEAPKEVARVRRFSALL